MGTVLPSIPEFVVCRSDEKIRCVMRDRPDREEPVPAPYSGLDGTAVLADGKWPCMEEDGRIFFFDLKEEKPFRSRRSQEIVAEAGRSLKDPIRALRLVEAAGLMHGEDVPGLVRELAAEGGPLKAAYFRMRSSGGTP